MPFNFTFGVKYPSFNKKILFFDKFLFFFLVDSNKVFTFAPKLFIV